MPARPANDPDPDPDLDLDLDLSSSPSIHSEDDIDFDYVYALHTFVATVEGQATAAKGDTLILLDDSNSYWWLVKLLKDQSIGYLPAEHIETPSERLARLNKHRNIDLASSMLEDHLVPRPSTRSSQKKLLFRSKPLKAVTIADHVSVFQVEPLEYLSDSESDLAPDPQDPAIHIEPADPNVLDSPVSRARAEGKTMSALFNDPESEIKVTLTPTIAQELSSIPPAHHTRTSFDSNSAFPDDLPSETKKKKSSVFGSLFKKKKKTKKYDHDPDFLADTELYGDRQSSVDTLGEPAIEEIPEKPLLRIDTSLNQDMNDGASPENDGSVNDEPLQDELQDTLQDNLQDEPLDQESSKPQTLLETDLPFDSSYTTESQTTPSSSTSLKSPIEWNDPALRAFINDPFSILELVFLTRYNTAPSSPTTTKITPEIADIYYPSRIRLDNISKQLDSILDRVLDSR
ncbi:Tip elongation aberrant protein Tea4 [Neolecta irregularis DAH-3]|uniref:Tip elongation aberrant protein Tea4 n=1 Tax=Neolecta irregularis (strain DAH-3) TaxID=1198029 RepID=A0A1U7LI49_NEOID|nr:Tip elongation aberrant protein Tea4 [Neolecta irregularis DAH-3]|eukprot:OLL22327.1 Tip elongation aberrant protein Tea4 [Neolecta irregularis DAH-3]